MADEKASVPAAEDGAHPASPAGASPVGASPVGASPVGASPVGASPAATPPAAASQTTTESPTPASPAAAVSGDDEPKPSRDSPGPDDDASTEPDPYQAAVAADLETGHSPGDGDHHHNHHHVALAASLSRIASNASSTVRRHLHERKDEEPLEHLPPPKIPLMDLDRGIVGWDHVDDPAMPLNFSSRRKWLNTFFLAAMSLMTPFASSILSPGIAFMDADFHNDSETMGSLAVSIYLLGYAVGPLFLAGLSEMYGRWIVLSCSNTVFCLWQIGCALAPSLDSMIAFRVFAGIGGSACMSLGGACIGDMFPVDERGVALAAWAFGPLVGPSIGPVVGAWLAQTIGWRWDFWIVLIAGTANAVTLAIFSTETSHYVLIRHKVARLSRELNRSDLRNCYDDPSKPKATARQALVQGLVRPLRMMGQSPILLAISVYIAFAYGVLYLLFNTIPIIFQEGYGWSIGITGLVYIPLGLGYCVGLYVFAKVSDATILRLTKRNGGVYEPEMRLVDCIYFACCLPITFFWYGWSADKHVHWIVPVLGLFPYGFAVMGIWQPAQTYVIDAFDPYSASALAVFSVLRSAVAAFLPLAGPTMYDSLGVGWGSSVLGFICAALIPVPVLLYRYGGYLRKKFPLSL